MKILHTSDWHLGKKLYKKDRLPEQKLFLNWLLETIETQCIEVLVISGDIFDTPMPPTEALSTFFNFLKNLEKISFLQKKSLKKVIIIGGNHDGAKLLEAPRPFLDNNLVTIVGRPKVARGTDKKNLKKWKELNSIEIEQDIFIGLLPYFRVSDFIDSPFKEFIDDYQNLNPQEQILAQMKVWSEKLLEHQSQTKILLGHHLFGSFMPGGSEQGVSLSGLDTIPLSLFHKWDILMLGHIHKAQVLKGQNPLAIYSGSPLPMRFSESNQKNIFVYKIDQNKTPHYEKQDIPIFRPLIKIKSSPDLWFKELIEALKSWGPSESPLKAYLELSIEFDEVQPTYVDFVREQIKELPVELLNFFALHLEEKDDVDKLKADVVRNSTIDELFSIYLDKRGVELKQKQELQETFKKVLRDQSEEQSESEL